MKNQVTVLMGAGSHCLLDNPCKWFHQNSRIELTLMLWLRLSAVKHHTCIVTTRIRFRSQQLDLNVYGLAPFITVRSSTTLFKLSWFITENPNSRMHWSVSVRHAVGICTLGFYLDWYLYLRLHGLLHPQMSVFGQKWRICHLIRIEKAKSRNRKC